MAEKVRLTAPCVLARWSRRSLQVGPSLLTRISPSSNLTLSQILFRLTLPLVVAHFESLLTEAIFSKGVECETRSSNRGGVVKPTPHKGVKSAAKQTPFFRKWRRGWDSNPRNPFRFTHFPGVRTRPGYATSPRRGAYTSLSFGISQNQSWQRAFQPN